MIFSDAESTPDHLSTYAIKKKKRPKDPSAALRGGAFQKIKNFGDQPPDLNLLESRAKTADNEHPSSQRQADCSKMRKLRVRRGILEQNFADVGLDPAETVSYCSDSQFIIDLIN